MTFDFVIPVVYNDQDISFNDDLGGALTRAGAKVAFIAHTQYGARALQARHAHVYYLYERYDADRGVRPEEIRAVEAKYELGSLADFVFPEQMVRGAEPKERLVRRALHDLRFLEQFCEQHDVHFFLNNLGPELMRRCMFRVRDQGGPQNIVQDFVPIHGRLALTTDEVVWDELPSELPTLSAEQSEAMKRYVSEATAARKMFCEPGALDVRPRNFVNAFRYARRSMAERVDFSVPALVYQRGESLLRVRAANHLYEQPREEPFLFFPLHLMDDSAITIRAPQFQRQEELVRYIAERVLPTGTKLYVKPHPAAMHAYSFRMLAEIASIPNVRLIDPRVVSHELIRRAEGIIVINSTVGFESMLYGKPVVTLGKVFYRGWGLTTDVDQLADLRSAVAHALTSPPPMEKVHAFLQACHAATYPGHLTEQTPENLELLTSAIFAKAEKLGQPVGAASGAGRAVASEIGAR